LVKRLTMIDIGKKKKKKLSLQSHLLFRLTVCYTPAFSHTDKREKTKDIPAAAPAENIALLDPKPSTYKTENTCPYPTKQGLVEGSTSLDVVHFFADDDPNREHEDFMVDAREKFIMTNPNKT
jgi:hypothetical protein